jgi:hypothetical protein
MKSKRKKVEKYNVGGYLQAGLAGAQTLYGLASLPAARAEFQRAQAAAPSLETPAQFYQNYKNAYDAELANLENEAIQANLATSVQALQGAGGRALVGGLPAATAGAARQRQQMLQQERALRMRAGEQLARAEEATIGRKEARSQREIAMANQGYQAALGNIGAGLGSMGTGLMYGMMGGDEPTTRLEDLGDAVNNEAPIKDVVETTETIPQFKTLDFDEIQRRAQENTEFVDQAAIDNAQQVSQQTNLPSLTSAITRSPFNYSDYQREARRRAGMGMRETMVDNTLTGKRVNEILESATYVGKKENLEEIKANTPSDMRVVTAEGNVYTIPMDNWQKFEKRAGEFLGGLFDAGTGQMNRSPVIQTLKKHGGMITDGEFNHNTNPIDIVQNGVKVGEATGNEVILNPTQAKKIANQSSYARKLFKSFERKAKRGK